MRKDRFIKFDKVDKYGILYISDDQLERLCYEQLLEYNPHCFETPEPLNVDLFIEDYLGLDISYYDLPNSRQLGFTARTDGTFKIIQNDEIQCRPIKKGEIVINTRGKTSEAGRGFSEMHESKHSQTDMDVSPEIFNQYRSKELFEDYAGRRERKATPLYFLEHQADKYAAYMLMPAPAIKKVFEMKVFEFAHHSQSWDHSLNLKVSFLVKEMASFFRVSREAMAIRMQELCLLSKEEESFLAVYKRGGR